MQKNAYRFGPECHRNHSVHLTEISSNRVPFHEFRPEGEWHASEAFACQGNPKWTTYVKSLNFDHKVYTK